MKTKNFGGKSYEVDEFGFITNHDKWDKNFAEGLAAELDMGQLTEEHWKVIWFIRDWFKDKGTCPLVYETARANHLFIRDFKSLFPTGYLRGACKLAGIAYADRFIEYYGEERPISDRAWDAARDKPKAYRLDVHGYLLDAADWDRDFAVHRAHEMKMGKLGPDHWRVIDLVRSAHLREKKIPTIAETCEKLNLELTDLERLFPDGYNRGVMKVAGLRPD